MLGPVRFEHIKNCARDAIAKSLSPSSTTQQGGKKAKIMVGVAVEEKRREELLRILPERDRSLVVLRGLLAEKKGGGGVGVGGGAGERGDGRNTVEYGTMSVGMLEALERTRDRSLGWVLGEIEKVEKAEGVDEGDGGGDAGRGGEGVAGGRKGGEGVEAEVGRQEPAPAPYDDETESLEDAEESLLLDLENESFDYNHI